MKQKQNAKWILSYKIIIILISLVVIAAIAWAVTIMQPKNEPAPNGIVTVEGTFECLTHKDPSKPHTMECAIGIKTANGASYGLKFEKDPSLASKAITGEKARITGKFTEQESIYNSRGVINVESLNKQ